MLIFHTMKKQVRSMNAIHSKHSELHISDNS